MDRAPYRYQIFCSDIAGQDIRYHRKESSRLIKIIRDWLQSSVHDEGIILPSGSRILHRYENFRQALPIACEKARLDITELTYNDYTTLVVQWLKVNPW